MSFVSYKIRNPARKQDILHYRGGDSASDGTWLHNAKWIAPTCRSVFSTSGERLSLDTGVCCRTTNEMGEVEGSSAAPQSVLEMHQFDVCDGTRSQLVPHPGSFSGKPRPRRSARSCARAESDVTYSASKIESRARKQLRIDPSFIYWKTLTFARIDRSRLSRWPPGSRGETLR